MKNKGRRSQTRSDNYNIDLKCRADFNFEDGFRTYGIIPTVAT